MTKWKRTQQYRTHLTCMVGTLLMAACSSSLDYEPAVVSNPPINCPGEVSRSDGISIEMGSGEVEHEQEQKCVLAPDDRVSN